MKENKDVLVRLKEWEKHFDKDISTQSTDAQDVSKKSENSTGGGVKRREALSEKC